jgi:hypothetical protein
VWVAQAARGAETAVRKEGGNVARPGKIVLVTKVVAKHT